MTELQLLKQEIASLRANAQQKDDVLEQQVALLVEQSGTIRQQELKLEAQQLRINQLLQQAFGRRSEGYLESPQQLKMDFGDSPRSQRRHGRTAAGR
jgi:hypothetical protein